MLISFITSCGTAYEETSISPEITEREESSFQSDEKTSIETSQAADLDSSSEEKDIDDEDEEESAADDKDTPKEKYGSYTFSRPISYNEMLEMFESYYEKTMQLDDSLDLDIYSSEEESICRLVAKDNGITYEEFNTIFDILTTEDQNRIKLKIQVEHGDN